MQMHFSRRLTVAFAMTVAVVSSMNGAEAKKGAPLPFGHSVATVGVLPVSAAWGAPIAFTEQVLAFEANPEKLKDAGFENQLTNCLSRIGQNLQKVKSGYNRLLRLNVYLRNDKDRVKAQGFISRYLPNTEAPLTFVSGELEHPDALVAMDAIALASIEKRFLPRAKRVAHLLPQGRHGKVAKWLMPGQRIFVSGQAIRAENIGDATRKTLVQLDETLKFLGVKWDDVVQVKSFLQPMSEVETVSREIASFFPVSNAPPQVFVQWTHKTPIEIELVVNGTAALKDAPMVEYLTPPKMKASPVFSRVVRVNRGKLIFTSSIYGPTDRGPENEIRSIFDELKLSMMAMGSDLNNLVKATYYVGNKESSSLLGKLRPDYYDPKRPPAASKAGVSGVGLPNHSISIDMIGVAEK